MAEEESEQLGDVPGRIIKVYREQVDYRRETALRVWLSFLLSFLVLRLLTYGIRYQFLPFHNIVTSSGLHIHHFVYGIFILLLVGFGALTLDQVRWHKWLALPFGIGAALVVDEFAIWLHLEDVYWAREGRSSIDLAILFTGVLGLYLAGPRFWARLVKESSTILGLLIRGKRKVAKGARRIGGRGGRS